MRRFHLFEWEDQPWLPEAVRDLITDQLQFTHREPMRRHVNAAIAQRLTRLIARTGARRIIDLCAGSGGPLVEIAPHLSKEDGSDLEIWLTDQYPNLEAFSRIERASGGRVRTVSAPTSAFDVPPELDGLRTLFTAFHHFRPEQAQRILSDAVAKRMPIAVFEPLQRRPAMAALVGAVSLLRGFTHMPRLGPLTPARVFWTYVVPLAPVAFAWDGMVSALRTYTPREMAELGRAAGGDDYSWEAGVFDVPGPYGPMPTSYLLGYPSDQPHVFIAEPDGSSRQGVWAGALWARWRQPLAEKKVAIMGTFARLGNRLLGREIRN